MVHRLRSGVVLKEAGICYLAGSGYGKCFAGGRGFSPCCQHVAQTIRAY
jgi:hypothetical protein